MTRYYNENPQVTYLLEKIKEQEEEIQHWKEMCEKLRQELHVSKQTCDGLKWSREYWREIGERFSKNFIAHNSLPWYKKMFFKFDV